jgi:putative hydrolase of the HAD superfamily
MNCTISKVNVVLFDFGGVLAEEGFANGLRAIALKNKLNEADFIKLAHDLIHATGYLTGHSDEHAYWQAIRNETGITDNDQTLRDEILERFTLRYWMFDIVDEIRTAGFKVAILSDQTNWLDELNRNINIFNHFDLVFNSYHLGKSKVDSSHFENILGHLGEKPEKVLFIDDKIEHCQTARNLGIHAIRYADRDSFIREISMYFPFLHNT